MGTYLCPLFATTVAGARALRDRGGGHAGGVLHTQRYGAFGNVIASAGASPNNLRYTGREVDPDTGLIYYRARYYCPDCGRFISEDPLGFGAGVNFYAYVGNNPVNGNDPSGMVKLPGIGAGIELLSAFRTVGHHTVPREVLKMLPSEVANNPLVRGAKGSPNIWQIPEDLHISIHQGKGGGTYNEAFKTRIAEFGDDITAGDVVNIRNELTEQFGLAQYRPGMVSSTLNEFGSVLATGAIIGLEALDVVGQILSPVTTFLFGSEAGRGSDIVSGLNGSSSANWWPSSATSTWNQSTANGGFVLYPNKANTNMIRSVYSK